MVEPSIGAATSADAEGRASIAAARQQGCVADVLIGSSLAGPSELIVAGQGAMKSGGKNAAPQSTTSGQRGRVALIWMGVGAGVGAATGVIYWAAAPKCRYKESLCPFAPIGLGGTGAFLGLMLGR